MINCFFDKTHSNIKHNSNVALTFWIGLRGYQIKAKTDYLTKESDFDIATNWIAQIHPNRIVKGLLLLDTVSVFDISIHNKQI